METLQPLSNRYRVPRVVNGKDSEFEVQAAAYTALESLNFVVRGEVKWCGRAQKGVRRETCRFDLVVYLDGEPWHIVEVKSGPMKHKRGLEATRQGQRYRHFGVPVTFIYGHDDIAPLCDYLLDRHYQEGAHEL